MATTSSPQQIDAFGVLTNQDATGLSMATAAGSSAYDLSVMAAASPIWFHPLRDGRHLMLNARRWYDVPPSGVSGAGGYYSTYTEDATPSWRIVNGPTAVSNPVSGQSPNIPTRFSVDSPQLVGAASRPPNNLYVLTSGTVNGSSQALVQNIYVSNIDSVTIAGEELAPTVSKRGSTIVFDKGIQHQAPYIIVHGTDATGAVYCARKLWYQIGTTKSDPAMGIQRGAPPVWEFYNGQGFSADSSELATTGLVTAGPMSFASCQQGTNVVSTVAQAGDVYTAQISQSVSGRPFVTKEQGIALGSSSDGTYLGGGLQLMSQLRPAASLAGTRASIPYVVNTKQVNSGSSRLVPIWGMWTVW